MLRLVHIRSWLHRRIMHMWYTPESRPPLWSRLLSYITQWHIQHQPPVNQQPYRTPLIVVGNLTAGGSGKTPLVAALVRHLQKAGWRPGIICRGDGGTHHNTPQQVTPTASTMGDEARMHTYLHVPVWQGRKRHEAAIQLLHHHPEVNILISDDGLQHRALHRDIELLMLNADRGIGNGWLIPAGPLREPTTRITQTDAVILYQTQPHAANNLTQLPGFKSREILSPPCFCVSLEIFPPQPLNAYLHDHIQPKEISCAILPISEAHHWDWKTWADKSKSHLRIAAMTAIAHPDSFFNALRNHGLTLQTTQAYPDHYRFTQQDIPTDVDIILITEKDAVKCTSFDQAPLWVVPSNVSLPEVLITLLNHRLEKWLHHDSILVRSPCLPH